MSEIHARVTRAVYCRLILSDYHIARKQRASDIAVRAGDSIQASSRSHCIGKDCDMQWRRRYVDIVCTRRQCCVSRVDAVDRGMIQYSASHVQLAATSFRGSGTSIPASSVRTAAGDRSVAALCDRYLIHVCAIDGAMLNVQDHGHRTRRRFVEDCRNAY